MTPKYYMRIAMAGWLFVAVVLASLWSNDANAVQTLRDQLAGADDKLIAAVVAAIVGLGAPPLLGFLLERIASLLLLCFKLNLWQYDAVTKYGETIGTSLNIPEARTRLGRGLNMILGRDPRGAAFHVIFYSEGNPEFVAWCQRRRTNMFASFTSTFAIGLGLIVSWWLGAVSSLVIGVSAFLIVFLTAHGLREGNYHRAAVTQWIAGKQSENERSPGKIEDKENGSGDPVSGKSTAAV